MSASPQRRRLKAALSVVLALYGLVMITVIVLAVLGETPWHTPLIGTGAIMSLLLRRWDEGSWGYLFQPAPAPHPTGEHRRP